MIPKWCGEHDVKVVEILIINKYLLFKVYGCWLGMGVLVLHHLSYLIMDSNFRYISRFKMYIL